MLRRKVSNSSLTKLGPLSVTITSGRPNVEKMVLRHWMVDVEVIDESGLASIHLVWASIRIRNILFMKGPAKSR